MGSGFQLSQQTINNWNPSNFLTIKDGAANQTLDDTMKWYDGFLADYDRTSAPEAYDRFAGSVGDLKKLYADAKPDGLDLTERMGLLESAYDTDGDLTHLVQNGDMRSGSNAAATEGTNAAATEGTNAAATEGTNAAATEGTNAAGTNAAGTNAAGTNAAGTNAAGTNAAATEATNLIDNAESAAEYKIQSGDTLGQIAKRHGVSVREIMDANPNITDANRIEADANLNIPKKSDAGVWDGYNGGAAASTNAAATGETGTNAAATGETGTNAATAETGTNAAATGETGTNAAATEAPTSSPYMADLEQRIAADAEALKGKNGHNRRNASQRLGALKSELETLQNPEARITELEQAVTDAKARADSTRGGHAGRNARNRLSGAEAALAKFLERAGVGAAEPANQPAPDLQLNSTPIWV